MAKTDSSPLRWVKSSYSTVNGGACVEWAPDHTSTTGTIPIRDSKNPTGPTLMLSPSAFTGLLTLARSSEL
ncbi:hypothetical protein GCM10010387_54230 [Streptomyces inusitatus]|uniref:DUF397 domain-containing protein n=1 Tax=Streptomyces inusitatus TaxID=68221 RepID=A0A918QLH1_9ACTN|nr:DUF397 domain-containing protein [Streptomyces inusitatus]GGZ53204.1 hypothetical protein GCM10010387_54230 [Streptomyces inusitatus]